jgi:hypothetical protein
LKEGKNESKGDRPRGKRVIKMDRAVDLRGKEVLLVKPCIKHAWKRHFWEGYL